MSNNNYLKDHKKIYYINYNSSNSFQNKEYLKRQYAGSSSLTPQQIEEIINDAKKNSIILEKGTELFRAQPNDCEIIPRKCDDTLKNGIYLANNEYFPLGMILEYNRPMNLCKYKTIKDIKLYYGKYNFRNLEPELFFQSYEDYQINNFNLNVAPENILFWNHYDNIVFPIDNLFLENTDDWKKINALEIFITDPNDLELIRTFSNISINSARRYIEEDLKKIKTYTNN